MGSLRQLQRLFRPMPLRAWPKLSLAGLWVSVGWLSGPSTMLATSPIHSRSMQASPYVSLQVQPCSAELPMLLDQMLRNLPSYINRVRTRAGIRKSYVVLAARPEFEPLPLAGVPSPSTTEKTQQVFFTMLVRRYDHDRISYLQEYHWVFLTPSAQGWQLVMMYSTLGPYPARSEQPPLPPRNSSNGSVAQAIQDWLSACNDSALKLPKKR
jgi:hypothetical protein